MFLFMSCCKAKASSIKEELLNAAKKLNGLGKNVCNFLANDLSTDYSSSASVASIGWMKAGVSFDDANSPITHQELINAMLLLKQSKSGAALIASMENAGIREKYMPLTIHVGNIGELINNKAPLAFNSLLQVRASAKAMPFVVLNGPSFKKGQISEKQLAVVIANELYDVLGRLTDGENVAATSNYQALGIILSDIVLKKEMASGNGPIQKAQVVFTYQKAMKAYSGDVPRINYQALSSEQKSTLDNLTLLATGGTFGNFNELEASTHTTELAMK
jgi:hypothetical protein